MDESRVLPAISELLNVAIEIYYNANDCRIYCEGKPVPSRILISLAILTAEKELAVAWHYLMILMLQLSISNYGNAVPL